MVQDYTRGLAAAATPPTAAAPAMAQSPGAPQPVYDLQYAGFWMRVGATLIDIVLEIIILIPLGYLVYGNVSSQGTIRGPADALINWVLPMVLVIALWVKYQATPGKMAYSAVIVDADTGGKPSVRQFVVRYFAYLLSSLPLCLGFLWVAWDKRKQAWHDKLAGTVVVRRREGYSVQFPKGAVAPPAPPKNSAF